MLFIFDSISFLKTKSANGIVQLLFFLLIASGPIHHLARVRGQYDDETYADRIARFCFREPDNANFERSVLECEYPRPSFTSNRNYSAGALNSDTGRTTS